MKKKNTLFNIIRICALLFFTGVLLYPTISDYLSRVNGSNAISEYKKQVLGISEETKQKLLEEAKIYNSSLSYLEGSEGKYVNDVDSDLDYTDLLKTSPDGLMASITIPAIDVKLPIYHTIKESVLQKGVGHMEGTSLPIGGDNTHAVLSGHRGLPSSRLFTDLDQLVEGDIFYIDVLGDTLAYKVNQIKIVLPHELEDIKIEDGKDYVTLVTCTPYSVNTHRLLVRGERIDYEKAIVEEAPEVSEGVFIPFEIKVLAIALPLLFIAIFIIRRKKHD